MFALKMSLKEKKKKVTVLVVHYCCLLSQGRERVGDLNYVNLYFALLFVDYWKSLRKHVSVVRLRVVVEVVCLALWLLVRKIMNLRLWDCHASGMATLFCLSLVGAKEQKPGS